MQKNLKLISILISGIFIILSHTAILQEMTGEHQYKEPSFDKEAIKKDIRQIVDEKKAYPFVTLYIHREYIRIERYNAAIFAFDSVLQMYPDSLKNFDQIAYGFCHVFSGREKSGIDIIRKQFLEIYYSDVDISQLSDEMQYELERKFDLYLIYAEDQGFNFHSFRNISEYTDSMISRFINKYKDINKDDLDRLNKIKSRNAEYRKERSLCEERIVKRKKMIDSYLRDLEKLLVERDEKKLRDFLGKYIRADRLEYFFNMYKINYINENYFSIKFILLEKNIGGKIDLKGLKEEETSISCQIITIPDRIGEKCPEAERFIFPSDICHTYLRLKFIDSKMFIY